MCTGAPCARAHAQVGPARTRMQAAPFLRVVASASWRSCFPPTWQHGAQRQAPREPGPRCAPRAHLDVGGPLAALLRGAHGKGAAVAPLVGQEVAVRLAPARGNACVPMACLGACALVHSPPTHPTSPPTNTLKILTHTHAHPHPHPPKHPPSHACAHTHAHPPTSL